MTFEEWQAFAQANGISFIELSPINKFNLGEGFDILLEKILIKEDNINLKNKKKDQKTIEPLQHKKSMHLFFNVNSLN